MRKIHGQEEGTQDYEGNVKITAFNMKEDMEDGHFDSAGNFIFNKNENEIKDGWLDNIDWTQVKRRAGKNWEKEGDQNDEEGEEAVPPSDGQLKEMYARLVSHLKPNETIMAAIKRIGAQRLSAAEERKRRWAAKKAGQDVETDQTKLVNELSGIADALVSQGHPEAYQFKKEQIEKLIEAMDEETSAMGSLDMFADEEPVASSRNAGASASVDEEVKWEYKFSEAEDAEIHGPVSTVEIIKLKDIQDMVCQGFARRVGSGAFYRVSRIDFDLYN
ncbi:hypothetical protein L596_024313 [Steinernema carpocapsae]|uniref:GYF domain-containing protein n=1 Tax=Steinernema carpocapsae TaxID=34508 RepID=A0A4U5MGD5_STECR|nr:hypothetical protein L596_024313 [Steinernema carpocapsae]